ncbi:MAG: metallophosphoesterase [Deltaproteobacteria bacterium]|nr:metallophosphoesterase [Deltaproteobacteria bacterium]
MSKFIAIFLLVYGSMHLYAFWRTRSAFEPSFYPALGLAAFFFFMMTSPLLTRFLERGGYGDGAAAVMAWIAFTWMGLLFLFICFSLVVDIYGLLLVPLSSLTGTRGHLFGISRPLAFYLPFAVTLLVAFYGAFEARNVIVEHVEIRSDKIPKEIAKLRIVQISDLHIGLLLKDGRVSEIAEILKKTEPHILVSTGDFVDGKTRELVGLVQLFKQINPKYGKYAVLGNHEYYAGIDYSLKLTRDAGFVVLRGSGATISGLINIAGVDDIAGKAFDGYKSVDEKTLLSGLPRDKFTLFLKHRSHIAEGSDNLFDLQLSGHTHRGQIFPFTYVVAYFFPHLSGLEDLPGGGKIYTSRGTGTWGPQMRVLSPPEVTVIDLVYGEKS